MGERWVPQTERDGLMMSAMKAVRAFSDSMDRMHGDMRGDMDMNASDLAALRMLIIREQRGEFVSPHEIAEHLSISTASTTKLLDRLTASGHVERKPHPSDRRARVIILTSVAREEFYHRFGQRMARMRDEMAEFSDDELRAATRFLDGMSRALTPAPADATPTSSMTDRVP